ncbi:hypothetical protein ACP70R_038014 [Stipagrostis hirtigluma subsp. patula]
MLGMSEEWSTALVVVGAVVALALLCLALNCQRGGGDDDGDDVCVGDRHHHHEGGDDAFHAEDGRIGGARYIDDGHARYIDHGHARCIDMDGHGRDARRIDGGRVTDARCIDGGRVTDARCIDGGRVTDARRCIGDGGHVGDAGHASDDGHICVGSSSTDSCCSEATESTEQEPQHCQRGGPAPMHLH